MGFLDSSKVGKVRYLIVLDINGLLCNITHVFSDKCWPYWAHLVRCGNKMVLP
jgi:hypothetical protein